jgi:glycosyltransferase involved in cell wall biosynthesis
VSANAQAFADAMASVPATPDAAETKRARASAERFGIEEQARRIAALYERLAPHSLGAATAPTG